jgi:hypothetical protein
LGTLDSKEDKTQIVQMAQQPDESSLIGLDSEVTAFRVQLLPHHLQRAHGVGLGLIYPAV